MNYLPQNLGIHIHKVDGSIESFTQSEAGLIKRILNEFHPVQVFAREKIIVADGNSLTSFPAHQIVRIDLVSEPSSHLIFAPGVVDAVEFTEAQYQALLNSPELGNEWNQLRAQNTSVVVFLEVELVGQKPLFLALEAPIDSFEPLSDRPETILYPLYPLAITSLCFRMQNGGVATLNLQHLMRFTLIPAPQDSPISAWPAHLAINPHSQSPTLDFQESVYGHLSHSDLQAVEHVEPASSRRTKNETLSTIES
jgi:hypothetical protein